MKYLNYARRSSEDKKRQIQSIPDQLEWADRKKEEMNLEIIASFQDTKTGTKPGREGFNEMMQFIEDSPEPLGILCWKMDRLARNPIDEGALKYAFMRGKINHILANDRQFREGENQILMGVEFGAATQFSIELSKNVTRGMSSKVRDGWRPTYASLGYLNDPAGLKGDRKIFPDPARWNKLKEGWEMLLTGAYTVPEILKYLNEELGLRTRKGRKLASSSLYAIFINPFYAGHFEWNGELIKGVHKPMITLEEYDMAQIILGRDGKPRSQKHESTYTGTIRCGECGCMVTAEPPKYKKNKGNGKVHVYHYLRCTKKSKNTKCSQKYIRVENLEEQIDELLQSIEIPDAFLKWAFKKLQKENKSKVKEFSVNRGQIQKEYNENEAMLENLSDDLARRVIDETTYKSCRGRYQKKRTQLKKELQKCEERKDSWMDDVMKSFIFAKNASQKFAVGDRNTKKELFVSLGSNFLLKDRKLSVELSYPFRCIQKSNEESTSLIPSLEPLKNCLSKPKKADLERLIPVWSTWRESNPRHQLGRLG